MKRINKFAALGLVLVILTILPGCVGQEEEEPIETVTVTETKTTPITTLKTTTPGPPIKLGVVHPMSGPAALLGQTARQGVLMAVDELNANGGLLGGRKIELTWGDDKCDPASAVDAIRQVITLGDVDAILGPQCSSAVLATMPVIDDEQVPMIVFAATSPKITEQAGAGGYKWTFRINPHDGLMGPAMAKVVVEELGIKTISMICLNNDWGRGNVMVWEELAPTIGFEVVSVDYFDYGETNFLPILTRIKEANPDAIFSAADYEEGHDIMKQFHELGMTQTVIGRGGLGTKKFAELYGADLAEGIYGINFYTIKIDTPEHQEFVRNFIATYDMEPEIVAAWSYTATYVMADAIERAGSTDKAAIRDALTKTDYTNFLGHITFDDHNQAYTMVWIYQILAGEEVLMYEVPVVPP